MKLDDPQSPLEKIKFVMLPSTPASPPPAGSVFIYPKTDGMFYVLDEDSIETALGGGGGSWIESSGTGVTVANTITETTVYSKVIDGGTLGSHKALRLKMQARVVHSIAGTITFRLKYGATTLLTIAVPAGVTTADKSSDIEFLVAASGATNAQRASGRVDMQDTPGGLLSRWNQEGVATEDSTASKTLELTVEWDSASSSLSFVRSWVGLELLG